MYAPARNNFAVLGVLEVQCRGHFIAQMRKWLGEPRGDQPRDVIPGPSAGGPRGDHPRDVIPGPSAGDSLAAGNIDLPEDVLTDELDNLLEDVTTASPKKEDRSLAKKLWKKSKLVSSLGPPLQISRPQWCTSVLLMWRLTWAGTLVAPYRMMSWRCSRPPGF